MARNFRTTPSLLVGRHSGCGNPNRSQAASKDGDEAEADEEEFESDEGEEGDDDAAAADDDDAEADDGSEEDEADGDEENDAGSEEEDQGEDDEEQMQTDDSDEDVVLGRRRKRSSTPSSLLKCLPRRKSRRVGRPSRYDVD